MRNEGTQSPKPTCPLGRALQEFRRLGWRSMQGWWQWSLPHSATVVHLVHVPKEYVEHLFRKALRENQLTALEKRWPRTFVSMGARLGAQTSFTLEHTFELVVHTPPPLAQTRARFWF